MVLKGLQPERVFYYFEKLSAIPHGSGNTKQISDYCADVAQSLGLAFRQDKLNNIVIYKDGSAGRENEEAVILQGHLDMVCEKMPDCNIDFAKDGLQLAVEGDMLSAVGTTLGGDDGIAIAMALAILEDKNLSHPPIEALFTVDEETGMYGAAGLDETWLQGKKLLNIDSEEEGVLTVGCAGGMRADIELEMIPTAVVSPCYRVVIGGLRGGHSGVEIGKGRHNANHLMGQLLYRIKDCMLISVSGGQKDNVICPYSEAVISTEADVVALCGAFVKEKYMDTDPDLCISVTQVTGEMVGYDSISTAAALTMLQEFPQGVQKMSQDVEGLVQTSLNFGVMRLEEDMLSVSFSLRSSVAAEKDALFQKLSSIAHKHGAIISARGDYPAWEFVKDSPLRNTMVSVYKRLYGQTPRVEIIHAGLECGLLSQKIVGMDAVSIGPCMWDIHSPAERLSISSVERTYNYVLEILKEI